MKAPAAEAMRIVRTVEAQFAAGTSQRGTAHVIVDGKIMAIPLFTIKETTTDELDEGLEAHRAFDVRVP